MEPSPAGTAAFYGRATPDHRPSDLRLASDCRVAVLMHRVCANMGDVLHSLGYAKCNMFDPLGCVAERDIMVIHRGVGGPGRGLSLLHVH